MKKTVLAVTMVSMLGWLTLAIRSSVAEAQIAQGTFTFTVGGPGTGITSSKVDAFSETVNAPAGTWSVEITKDIDVTTPNLRSDFTTGVAFSSARVTIGGVTRRFQNGQIVNVQSVSGVVPQEKISLVFATSN